MSVDWFQSKPTVRNYVFWKLILKKSLFYQLDPRFHEDDKRNTLPPRHPRAWLQPTLFHSPHSSSSGLTRGPSSFLWYIELRRTRPGTHLHPKYLGFFLSTSSATRLCNMSAVRMHVVLCCVGIFKALLEIMIPKYVISYFGALPRPEWQPKNIK